MSTWWIVHLTKRVAVTSPALRPFSTPLFLLPPLMLIAAGRAFGASLPRAFGTSLRREPLVSLLPRESLVLHCRESLWYFTAESLWCFTAESLRYFTAESLRYFTAESLRYFTAERAFGLFHCGGGKRGRLLGKAKGREAALSSPSLLFVRRGF